MSPVPDIEHCDPFKDYAGFAPSERQIEAARVCVTQRAKVAVQSLSVPFLYEPHVKQMSFGHHAPVQSTAQAVLETADKIGADLIVVPSSQPYLDSDNPLRGIARTVTEYANQNCLVIPVAFLKSGR